MRRYIFQVINRKPLLILSGVFAFLVQPRTKNGESEKRGFILNILLLGTISMSFLATMLARLDYIQDIKEKGVYHGVPVEIVASIALTFLALYFFARAGKSRLVSYIFIWLYFIPAFYTSYNWGADVPQALLIYVLVIVMAGVLISTKFALVMTAISSIALFIISYLQIEEIILVDIAWTNEPLHLRDTGVYIATLFVIALVSWLFNREIDKALRRVRKSETALKEERDLLEIRVKERTKELRKAQLEKMLHLYRFAKLGRLAAGLFHDFVNPLTLVSLNLEQLQAQSKKLKTKGIPDTKPLLERAIKGTQNMENFAQAVKRQIQEQEIEVDFNLAEEISLSLDVLAHRAKEAKVKVRFTGDRKIRTLGNPIRFNQVITNLVSNAIDACESIKRKGLREVIIGLSARKDRVILTVQDFGCGIDKKNLKKIFEPFYTTKGVEKGVGIGLLICKDIVKDSFGGKIKVKSKKGGGSTFTVEFPIRKGLRKRKSLRNN